MERAAVLEGTLKMDATEKGLGKSSKTDFFVVVVLTCL